MDCLGIGITQARDHVGRYHAKAQNLARQMKAAYDAQFASYNLLLMPTLTVVATPIPAKDAPLSEFIQRAFEMVGATCQFDVTGHPSMSVPYGLVDGLPVGMMLTTRDWNEATIYQAASAFEAEGDWKTF